MQDLPWLCPPCPASCPRRKSHRPIPGPAASNGACGFPALRSPACFVPWVMCSFDQSVLLQCAPDDFALGLASSTGIQRRERDASPALADLRVEAITASAILRAGGDPVNFGGEPVERRAGRARVEALPGDEQAREQTRQGARNCPSFVSDPSPGWWFLPARQVGLTGGSAPSLRSSCHGPGCPRGGRGLRRKDDSRPACAP